MGELGYTHSYTTFCSTNDTALCASRTEFSDGSRPLLYASRGYRYANQCTDVLIYRFPLNSVSTGCRGRPGSGHVTFTLASLNVHVQATAVCSKEK